MATLRNPLDISQRIGGIPNSGEPFTPLILHVMKTHEKKKALTFGGFIAAAYRACGKRRARGIVQLAVNAHPIEFRGPQRFMIS